MQGLMQATPLTLPMIFRRAERMFADKAVISAGPKAADGRAVRHADDLRRSGRLAPGASAACSTG